MPDQIRTAAVFKIMALRRPNSGEVIGEQMVIAVPNQGRYDRVLGDYVQSFARKWRICESSPYPPGGITKEIQDKWVAKQEAWHKCRALGAA